MNSTPVQIWPTPNRGCVGAAYDASRDAYWVCNWNDDTVTSIGAATGVYGATFSLSAVGCTRPAGVGYDLVNDELIVGGRDQSAIVLIDAATGALNNSFPAQDGGNNPPGTASDPTALSVWHSSWNSATIFELDSGHGGSSGPGITYCPGDGVAPHTPCPCANNNDGSMSGCDWVTASGSPGAALTATGDANYANPDVILIATNVENNFGVFFGANNQTNGGNGSVFGDGLRCAGGGLIRLTPPIVATGNTASHGPVEASDTGAMPGVTRRYQYWFRTPGGPCGTIFNLSNGYEIAWL